MPTNPQTTPGNPDVRRWRSLMQDVRDAWPLPAERPPLSLWAALIDAESGGRPHVISPAGAVGLGQVMPSDYAGYTPRLRQMFRDRPTTAALLDPHTNLEWSLRILITLGYRRCKSWPSALMAYFTGRCDAPAATDATGTSGAHYVRLILARAPAYADLDQPPHGESDPARPEPDSARGEADPARGEPVEPRAAPSLLSLDERLARLEALAHRHGTADPMHPPTAP